MRKEIGEPIERPKNHWKRRRPYEMDEHLVFGRPEKNYGYPSGHASRGMVEALVLAELFPEKKEGILAIGRDIGWDRVLIGKHFPRTSMRAVCAQAIVRELLASPAFQHDLAEAKAKRRPRNARLVEGQTPAEDKRGDYKTGLRLRLGHSRPIEIA